MSNCQYIFWNLNGQWLIGHHYIVCSMYLYMYRPESFMCWTQKLVFGRLLCNTAPWRLEKGYKAVLTAEEAVIALMATAKACSSWGRVWYKAYFCWFLCDIVLKLPTGYGVPNWNFCSFVSCWYSSSFRIWNEKFGSIFVSLKLVLLKFPIPTMGQWLWLFIASYTNDVLFRLP